MALTEDDKTDIRRYLGYGFLGTEPGAIPNVYAHRVSWYLEDRLNKLTSAEEIALLRVINRLRDMEDEMDLARQDIDIKAADVYIHNTNEMNHRISLFNRERRLLGQFLSVPLGDGGNGIQWVV